jgi:hypothetical protein
LSVNQVGSSSQAIPPSPHSLKRLSPDLDALAAHGTTAKWQLSDGSQVVAETIENCHLAWAIAENVLAGYDDDR